MEVPIKWLPADPGDEGEVLVFSDQAAPWDAFLETLQARSDSAYSGLMAFFRRVVNHGPLLNDDLCCPLPGAAPLMYSVFGVGRVIYFFDHPALVICQYFFARTPQEAVSRAAAIHAQYVCSKKHDHQQPAIY